MSPHVGGVCCLPCVGFRARVLRLGPPLRDEPARPCVCPPVLWFLPHRLPGCPPWPDSRRLPLGAPLSLSCCAPGSLWAVTPARRQSEAFVSCRFCVRRGGCCPVGRWPWGQWASRGGRGLPGQVTASMSGAPGVGQEAAPTWQGTQGLAWRASGCRQGPVSTPRGPARSGSLVLLLRGAVTSLRVGPLDGGRPGRVWLKLEGGFRQRVLGSGVWPSVCVTENAHGSSWPFLLPGSHS